MEEVLHEFDGKVDALKWFVFNILNGIKFFMGKISNREIKELLITDFAKGITIEELNRKGKEFSSKVIPKLLNQKACQRIQWHYEQGHELILLSASLHSYLDPWAKKHRFSQVIANELELDKQGRITGKILGKNCYGEEKLNRLKAFLGEREKYIIFAYGDSKDDRPFIEIADYPSYKSF